VWLTSQPTSVTPNTIAETSPISTGDSFNEFDDVDTDDLAMEQENEETLSDEDIISAMTTTAAPTSKKETIWTTILIMKTPALVGMTAQIAAMTMAPWSNERKHQLLQLTIKFSFSLVIHNVVGDLTQDEFFNQTKQLVLTLKTNTDSPPNRTITSSQQPPSTSATRKSSPFLNISTTPTEVAN
jgi:hypothetical protein